MRLTTLRTLAVAGTLVGLVALLSTACSDDTPPGKKDSAVTRPDKGTPQEAGGDGPLDAALDAPAKDAAGDAAGDAGKDAAADAGKEAAAPDQGRPDRGAPDMGTPAIWGYITASASPLLDGRGDLYVGVYFPFPPAPASFKVGGVTIKNADFSKPGAKIKYVIQNNAPGPHSLYAFLDDNKNANNLFLFPDYGDLVVKAAKAITVKSGTALRVDLDLSVVMAAGDAGVGPLGALKGNITAKVSPNGDGKGTVHLSLHSQLPPAGKVASGVVANADLSSPFLSESYLMSGVQQGKYYLQAFLDDNNSVGIFAPPNPDKGDMIHSKPLQVRVVAGTINLQDVVFDAIKQ